MISHTTEHFRKLLARLPKEIQEQAREAYGQFKKNPYHPGLRFKRLHSKRSIYAIRISRDYRAIGLQQDGEIIWFWIGSHADYDKILREIRHT